MQSINTVVVQKPMRTRSISAPIHDIFRDYKRFVCISLCLSLYLYLSLYHLLSKFANSVDPLAKSNQGQTGYQELIMSANVRICVRCLGSRDMRFPTIKASDQPAHMHSLIRAFASRLNIL